MLRRSGRSNPATPPTVCTRSRKSVQNANENGICTRNGNKQQQGEQESSPLKSETEATPKAEAVAAEAAKQDQQNESEHKEEGKPEVEQAPQPIVIDVKDESGGAEAGAEGNNGSTQAEVTDEEMRDVKPEIQVDATVNADSQSQVNAQAVSHASATTKALNRLQKLKDERKVMKKRQKIPLSLRRRKLNQRLNKILTPKSGLIFLHELRPGCTYKFQEQPGSNPTVFVAQVECNGQTLAVGQGMSKPSAKNAAAENAIKAIVAEMFAQKSANRQSQEQQGKQVVNSSVMDELMDTSDELSWAGLASFAMYKMFSEWQNQGADFPLIPTQPKKKVTATKPPPVKKDLPPNADKLHPSLLLNIMRPGVVSVELDRNSKDNVSFVTVGYEIDGKMYKGSGTNKKEGRKAAAKLALADLYGLKYED